MFATMLLTMLNAAMYPGKAAALRWEEVNLESGEVVTRRPKTGVVRTGILWSETRTAIKAIRHDRDEVFKEVLHRGTGLARMEEA